MGASAVGFPLELKVCHFRLRKRIRDVLMSQGGAFAEQLFSVRKCDRSFRLRVPAPGFGEFSHLSPLGFSMRRLARLLLG
jgi:hypothetical protein